MTQKLLSLFGKFRKSDDAVIEARFSALGKAPSRRARRTTISPFKFVPARSI